MITKLNIKAKNYLDLSSDYAICSHTLIQYKKTAKFISNQIIFCL